MVLFKSHHKGIVAILIVSFLYIAWSLFALRGHSYTIVNSSGAVGLTRQQYQQVVKSDNMRQELEKIMRENNLVYE